MSRVDRTAAIGLALGMLGVPTASAIAQEASSTSEVIQEPYRAAISAFEQFINFTSNPIVENLHTNFVQNPEDFIAIVDSIGTKDFNFFPGADSLFFYNTPVLEGEVFDPDLWSIAIDIRELDPNTVKTSLFIKLNYSGHVYQGSGDLLPIPGTLPITTSALQADYLFNIPDEMQLNGWRENPKDPFSATRRYYDPNVGSFTQEIRRDTSLISLAVTSPIPTP